MNSLAHEYLRLQPEGSMLHTWGMHLLHNTPDEFTQFMKNQEQTEMPNTLDINGLNDLTPTSMLHWCFGMWKDVQVVDEAIRGLLALYDIRPKLSLLHSSQLTSILERKKERKKIPYKEGTLKDIIAQLGV